MKQKNYININIKILVLTLVFKPNCEKNNMARCLIFTRNVKAPWLLMEVTLRAGNSCIELGFFKLDNQL